MNSIDQVFKETNDNFLSQLTDENKKNLHKLTFSNWIHTEYLKLNRKYSKIDFTEKACFTYVEQNLQEDLRKFLHEFSEAGYHISKYPILTKIDLEKDCKLENLQVSSLQKSNNEYNKFIAENRSQESFDFQKKSVILIDPDTGLEIMKFPTESEAKKYLRITNHRSDIIECCEGKRETAHGFKWKYYIENSKQTVIF